MVALLSLVGAVGIVVAVSEYRRGLPRAKWVGVVSVACFVGSVVAVLYLGALLGRDG